MKEIVKFLLRRLGVYTFFFRTVFENRLILKSIQCFWRYRRLAKAAKRKPKGEKIRVLFIVSEIAKWKEQSLYEAMERSGEFDPIVGISAWNKQAGLSVDELEVVHKKAEEFFDKMGDRHVRTVTSENGAHVYHDLSEFKPDIVFYTEQWSPCPKQHPFEVSKYALTCFLPYYVPDFGITQIDCHQQVERMCWTYFCLGESWARLYRRSLLLTCHCNKFVVTGHPALDVFYKQRYRKPKEDYVIYAPHFSFPHPRQQEFYLIGTFEWSGMAILQYAEAHPEIKWVFKPHPILRGLLSEFGVMSKSEVDEYYARWERIGLACYDSDYQELFLESRVMITDSGSFLPEYGSTGRPVIRLVCAKNKHIPPKAAREVYDTYYNVHNLGEMRDALRLVVEEGEDPNRDARIEAVHSSGLASYDASRQIIVYLRKSFSDSNVDN